MSDRARVRRLVPPGSGAWVDVEIVLQSKNGQSLMVTAPEGLSTGAGIALLGDQMSLALSRETAIGSTYRDILSGSRWQLERQQ